MDRTRRHEAVEDRLFSKGHGSKLSYETLTRPQT